jgi:hypothetical protein
MEFKRDEPATPDLRTEGDDITKTYLLIQSALVGLGFSAIGTGRTGDAFFYRREKRLNPANVAVSCSRPKA